MGSPLLRLIARRWKLRKKMTWLCHVITENSLDDFRRFNVVKFATAFV